MNTFFRQFRGTILALVAFALVGVAFWKLQPHVETPLERKAKKGKEDGVALFAFEKSDLTKVMVERPDGTINLAEKPDGWWIDGADGIADGSTPTGKAASPDPLPASRSMVNRVKHQLHDLVSRATVVENTGDMALYGLGQSAIHVTLQMRDGSIHTFDAGDPNPSGVSFYIRPTPGDIVYTVKKSAVDYYSLSLAEFRERRFASFDSKDVDALDVKWAASKDFPDGRHLRFQRTGEHGWDLLEPEHFAASDDGVRGLMGRVSALKAVKFVTDRPTPEDLATYGLDHPKLQVALTFEGKDPITLQVGNNAPEKDGTYDLAYVRLAEDPSVYTARNGLLEDYAKEPASYRLMRFGRMDPNRVSLVAATFVAPPPDKDTPAIDNDADLNGTVTVHMAADSWMWDDGVPVAGSTPKRVAQRAADIEADEFVSSTPADTKYGFDHPIVSMHLQDLDGTDRTLLVGKKGPPTTDHDGRDRDRYYARVSDHDEVYLVDTGILEVVKDLMREHRRKLTGDDAKDQRDERIDAEHQKPVGPQLPGQPDRPGMPPRPGMAPRPPPPAPTKTPATGAKKP